MDFFAIITQKNIFSILNYFYYFCKNKNDIIYGNVNNRIKQQENTLYT